MTIATLDAATDLVTPTGRLVLPAGAPRREWLRIRQTGIGSSDIAAICGLDKYTSPLGVYLDKRGEFAMPRTDRLEEAARLGLRLEDVISAEFADRTGFEIVPTPGTVAHVDVPWMLANVDRLFLNPAMRHRGIIGPLEMKSRSAYQAAEWEQDAPAGPVVQTQWQLGVTGYERGYVAALIGGNHLVWHEVVRDDEMVADLLRIAREFWGWVCNGTPPPPDGSDALAQMLNKRFAVTTAEPVIADPADVTPWLTQRATAKAAIAQAEAQVTEAENHLKLLAAEHEVVMAGGEVAFTWKRHTRRDIDRQAMREDGVYDTYLSETHYRRFDVPKGMK